jgi:hypothetical protein
MPRLDIFSRWKSYSWSRSDAPAALYRGSTATGRSCRVSLSKATSFRSRRASSSPPASRRRTRGRAGHTARTSTGWRGPSARRRSRPWRWARRSSPRSTASSSSRHCCSRRLSNSMEAFSAGADRLRRSDLRRQPQQGGVADGGISRPAGGLCRQGAGVSRQEGRDRAAGHRGFFVGLVAIVDQRSPPHACPARVPITAKKSGCRDKPGHDGRERASKKLKGGAPWPGR